MIRKEPGRVVVITPKGIVYVARALFECLENRMPPDELVLLRDFDWWSQASQLVSGIQIATPAALRKEQA